VRKNEGANEEGGWPGRLASLNWLKYDAGEAKGTGAGLPDFDGVQVDEEECWSGRLASLDWLKDDTVRLSPCWVI
jgi:hypothetical protein